MADHVRGGLRDHRMERVAVRNVELGEACAVGQVLSRAGREIVDGQDLVAAGEEGIDDVRADEPGSPGDDDPHR
jgi:hypothetical protein